MVQSREVLAQAVRFGIAGGIATVLGAATYWTFANFAGVGPMVANFFGYLLAAVSGYLMYSRWSFKGHGRRENALRTTSRFFLVSLVSLGLNSFFVWLLMTALRGPNWWPVITMVFVTPVITFLLNRQWVFR
jgi:putative flippase GtrA